MMTILALLLVAMVVTGMNIGVVLLSVSLGMGAGAEEPLAMRVAAGIFGVLSLGLTWGLWQVAGHIGVRLILP